MAAGMNFRFDAITVNVFVRVYSERCFFCFRDEVLCFPGHYIALLFSRIQTSNEALG